MVARLMPPDHSGAGQQAARVSEALCALGIAVRIFTSGKRRLPENTAILGVPTFRWPTSGAGSQRVRNLWFAAGLICHLIINPRRYGILHVHGMPSVLRALGKVKKLFGFSVIYKATMDGGDDPARLIGFWGDEVITTVDRWACISRAIADGARKAGVSEERILLIPNGVDISAFRILNDTERSRIREQFRIPPEAIVWVTVGALVERKRIGMLIEAWDSMPDRDCFLLVLGPANRHPQTGMPTDEPNPYADRLVEMIAGGGLEGNVRLLGDQDRVADLLGAADGFAFASIKEGSPNAVIEALACGLPVVMTSLPAAMDLKQLGGDSLVVVDPTPQAIAEAVRNTSTDSRQVPVGISSISIEETARKYARCYSELGI